MEVDKGDKMLTQWSVWVWECVWAARYLVCVPCGSVCVLKKRPPRHNTKLCFDFS